jgi:hypothetical protein
MAQNLAFHSTCGGYDFLGLRKTSRGTTEIVYDDGVKRRMIWKVSGYEVNEARLCDALRLAVNNVRVIPALYQELKKRSIAIEMIGH